MTREEVRELLERPRRCRWECGCGYVLEGLLVIGKFFAESMVHVTSTCPLVSRERANRVMAWVHRENLGEFEGGPEDELDPEKLQREYLDMGREILADLKAKKEKARKEEEEAAKRMEDAAGALPAMGTVVGFRPPSFREVSERCRKAWEEVKRIMPDAPPEILGQVFMFLQGASDEEPEAPERLREPEQ